MILVTGATGTVGSVVVELLAPTGRVRALAHSDASLAALDQRSVPAVRGDLGDAASLPASFDGVDQLVLITPFGPDQAAWETNALDAAQAAGVRRVVKLSVLDAGPGPQPVMVATHRLVEANLAGRPFASVVIRSDWFCSNVQAQVPLIKGGVMTYPFAEALTAPVDPRDVAEVIVSVLGEPGEKGSGLRVIECTGPQTLSLRAQVDLVAKATGRPVAFIDASADDWRSGAVASGVDPGHADALVELLGAYSGRAGDVVTTGVVDVLGRPPRPMERYLLDELRL